MRTTEFQNHGFLYIISFDFIWSLLFYSSNKLLAHLLYFFCLEWNEKYYNSFCVMKLKFCRKWTNNIFFFLAIKMKRYLFKYIESNNTILKLFNLIILTLINITLIMCNVTKIFEKLKSRLKGVRKIKRPTFSHPLFFSFFFLFSMCYAFSSAPSIRIDRFQDFCCFALIFLW